MYMFNECTQATFLFVFGKNHAHKKKCSPPPQHTHTSWGQKRIEKKSSHVIHSNLFFTIHIFIYMFGEKRGRLIFFFLSLLNPYGLGEMLVYL